MKIGYCLDQNIFDKKFSIQTYKSICIENKDVLNINVPKNQILLILNDNTNKECDLIQVKNWNLEFFINVHFLNCICYSVIKLKQTRYIFIRFQNCKFYLLNYDKIQHNYNDILFALKILFFSFNSYECKYLSEGYLENLIKNTDNDYIFNYIPLYCGAGVMLKSIIDFDNIVNQVNHSNKDFGSNIQKLKGKIRQNGNGIMFKNHILNKIKIETQIKFKFNFDLNTKSEKIKEKITNINLIFDQINNKQKYKNVVLCFNGGKDCTILLFLWIYYLNNKFQNFKIYLQVLIINNDDCFDEILNFINQVLISINLTNVYQIDGNFGMKNALITFKNEYPNIDTCLIGTR